MSTDTLVFVASYNSFSDLAHEPKGTPAKYSLSIFRFDPDSSSMTLVSVTNVIHNPAFLRWSPCHNILYACSESIQNEDTVASVAIVPLTGHAHLLAKQHTKGKSACYITLSKTSPPKHMLVVNYWDSSISTFPIQPTGLIGPVSQTIFSKKTPTVVSARHEHIANRHAEAHVHAIVLDPIMGRIAYVPDLGEDCIKQYVFNPQTGELTQCGVIAPSKGEGPFGPRYLDFHPTLPLAYIVNEVASTVSVFAFRDTEAKILASDPSIPISTLDLLQTVSTVPLAFPKGLNTCGRIAVDPSGKYVLVSNRGHNSIAVFQVLDAAGSVGILRGVGFFHTRGSTPRHFQFDPSGTHLIVANQDTDNVSVFRFNPDNGSLTFTGNSYHVPSPNFVCCVKPHTTTPRL